MEKGKAESLAYVRMLQDPVIFMLYIFDLNNQSKNKKLHRFNLYIIKVCKMPSKNELTFKNAIILIV